MLASAENWATALPVSNMPTKAMAAWRMQRLAPTTTSAELAPSHASK